MVPVILGNGLRGNIPSPFFVMEGVAKHLFLLQKPKAAARRRKPKTRQVCYGWSGAAIKP